MLKNKRNEKKKKKQSLRAVGGWKKKRRYNWDMRLGRREEIEGEGIREDSLGM